MGGQVQAVLAGLGPELERHGCRVELAGVRDGVVSVRLLSKEEK